MGSGVMGLGLRVWCLVFGVWGLGFGFWGFGVWVLGFGFWGLGFRARILDDFSLLFEAPLLFSPQCAGLKMYSYSHFFLSLFNFFLCFRFSVSGCVYSVWILRVWASEFIAYLRTSDCCL